MDWFSRENLPETLGIFPWLVVSNRHDGPNHLPASVPVRSERGQVGFFFALFAFHGFGLPTLFCRLPSWSTFVTGCEIEMLGL
jgi:hypothetical protein